MELKEKTAKIFKEFGGNEKNTGSVEGQIAHFTNRIEEISSHLKTHHHDFSTSRALLQLVGKRKKLLKYLSRIDIVKYRGLLEKLNLRK